MQDKDIKEIKWDDMLLRKVAGATYLIDVSQSGKPYHRPVVLNDSGAYIVERLIRGERPEQIAQEFAAADESLKKEEILGDIDLMIRDIRENMKDE